MGYWSTLPFGNDDASDWLSEFVEDPRFERVEQALLGVLHNGSQYVEAPLGARALAACEVIAKLAGRGTQQDASTRQLDAWVKSSAIHPSAVWLGAGRRVIDRVAGEQSELRDIWAESEEFLGWQHCLGELHNALAAPANIEPARSRVLLVIAPFAALTAVIMYLSFDQRGWTPRDVAFEVLFGAVAVLVCLGAINSSRFWWATRTLALLIFLVYAWFVVDQGLLEPSRPNQWFGASSSFSALLGFCVYGIPAVLYAFSGSTQGPIARRSMRSEVKPSDLNYLLLARLARWVFLASIAVLVVARLIQIAMSHQPFN